MTGSSLQNAAIDYKANTDAIADKVMQDFAVKEMIRTLYPATFIQPRWRGTMTSHTPIQTPVTGLEHTGNQREAIQALSQFYSALNARDLDMMQRNWANTAEAAMDNPLGGIKRGWSEIRTTYEKLFGSKGTYRFEFYDYTLHEVDNLFYVVGRERGDLNLDGRLLKLAIRTSRIVRRDTDFNLRQVHHHGSIDDPQMLAKYQEAVLGRAEASADSA